MHVQPPAWVEVAVGGPKSESGPGEPTVRSRCSKVMAVSMLAGSKGRGKGEASRRLRTRRRWLYQQAPGAVVGRGFMPGDYFLTVLVAVCVIQHVVVLVHGRRHLDLAAV